MGSRMPAPEKGQRANCLMFCPKPPFHACGFCVKIKHNISAQSRSRQRMYYCSNNSCKEFQMTYVPEHVVKYFAVRNAIPLPDAREVFSQLDDFLSSATTSRKVPSVELDEAWHIFLLHSIDYAEYCMSRFGRFIHHVPHEIESIEDESAGYGRCSSNCSTR